MARSRNTELDDALAALIASTNRVRRKLNLLEVAEKLRIAREHLGSLRAVGEAVGLSREMLRQFARVEKLAAPVKRMLAEGKIESVDIGDRITRLPTRDQPAVAMRVARGELTGDDLRAILSLRKGNARAAIDVLIAQAVSTRPKKEYVLEFLLPVGTSKRRVTGRLLNALKSRGMIAAEFEGRMGRLVVDLKGLRYLQRQAKRCHLSKGSLVALLVAGEKCRD